MSLLGDGAFLVAMAWEAYTLSNAPTALSLLGIAMTVPLIALLLFGGVVSDRRGRRQVMLIADIVRAVLLGLLGALAASGTPAPVADDGDRRHLRRRAGVLRPGQRRDPARSSCRSRGSAKPTRSSRSLRPLALRLLGPALGGVLVGVLGPGAAFLADAATFVVSAVALWSMSARASASPLRTDVTLVRASEQAREGWAYVRRHVWLWGTFASAGIAYLLFMGPAEVLLPFMVKHELHGSGVQLGLVLGAGGLGSVAAGVAMMRSGLPTRSMTFIYVVWTLGTLAVAGYGLATAMWELMLASVAFNLLETAGTIVWATMKQRHVPGAMLGRVSSLDWLISIGLLPVSFALTAPLSAAFGVRTTLIVAGVAGAAATLGGLMLPGMRAVDAGWQSGAHDALAPSTPVAQAS